MAENEAAQSKVEMMKSTSPFSLLLISPVRLSICRTFSPCILLSLAFQIRIDETLSSSSGNMGHPSQDFNEGLGIALHTRENDPVSLIGGNGRQANLTKACYWILN